MRDLFSSNVEFSPIQMIDADVSYLQHLPMPMSDDEIFRKLLNDTMWKHEKVRVWGKEHYQPRLTAWHGDPGKKYIYSGTLMLPEPWTYLLLSIKREIEELVQESFNSVLLNLY